MSLVKLAQRVAALSETDAKTVAELAKLLKGKPKAKRRGRNKKQSEAMKKYWAERKAKEAKVVAKVKPKKAKKEKKEKVEEKAAA